MRSFEEYRVDTNEIIIRSAAKIFEKQLKSPEGRDLEIDGVPVRGIIYNKTNPYSDTEYRTMSVRKDVEVRRGSYILFNNEYYLNTNDMLIIRDSLHTIHKQFFLNIQPVFLISLLFLIL